MSAPSEEELREMHIWLLYGFVRRNVGAAHEFSYEELCKIMASPTREDYEQALVLARDELKALNKAEKN